MGNNEVVLRFSDVFFDYGHNKEILNEASFSIRTGSKVALMGQNGAGKSSLFKLITKELEPKEGGVFLTPKDTTVGIARQVIPPEHMELTVRDYFASAFAEIKYDLDKHIRNVLEAVNLDAPLERIIKSFSGGQQARLLLAYALIQNPDILLLDEPTNNLDQTGIEHLTGFLMMYEKTCMVISHDAEFLNAFTDGVVYLDVFTHKTEQYTGNYFDVVEEIAARIERENLQNARMESEIKKKLGQAEVFAHKGGKLRAVAKRMREAAEEAEESIVEVRREDKTIREFEIPVQEFDPFFNGLIAQIDAIKVFEHHQPTIKTIDLTIRKNTHVLISGPNGAGKSTFLHALTDRSAEGAMIPEDIKIGYYKQDFGNLDFEQKAFDCLLDAMQKNDEHILRATAASFLLDGRALDNQVKSLSEGQKGLLSFARLVLMKPGLLVLDEPTNHINFRHLPVIAKALDHYQGGMLMVSHIPDFVSKIRIDQTINLNSLK
ncbi:MAG: ATP-binding cassette domain-containing protein [Legionella sp.]|uniref:ATP-binding cassette domain-containing protein n=1 Tax=Legionella sp. TaxID=459 RepID=UPI00284AF571|nr:ATP-binding cassette domain-containing protein [Legionella sp.]